MKIIQEYKHMRKIPYKIHYCWFGNNPKSAETKKYIDGWKKTLRKYELIEWNEHNFPIHKFPFAEQAYREGKYAFVSDAARVYALYKYGGVYLDTDVEVLRDFSECLEEGRLVLGFEAGGENLMTAFLAAAPGHPVMEDMVRYYTDHNFSSADGGYQKLANTILITDLMRQRGLERNNLYQQLPGDIRVFPEEYFSAYELRYENRLRTENTYTLHHFSGSWMPLSIRFKKVCKKMIRTFLGDKALRKLLVEK